MNATPGTDSPADSGVVIVTERLATGEELQLRERRYGAHRWEVTHYETERGQVPYLQIFRDGTTQPVAGYPAGAWHSIRYEGALVPDGSRRALEIAMDALANLRVQLSEAPWQLEHTSYPALFKAVVDLVERAQRDVDEVFI